MSARTHTVRVMSFKCALLSNDPVVLKLLQPGLSTLKLQVERLGDAEKAAAELGRAHYDAVVLDLESGQVDEVAGIITKMRADELNRSSITIALTRGTDGYRAGYKCGANFVLDKPLRSDTVAKTLRAAMSLIQKNVS